MKLVPTGAQWCEMRLGRIRSLLLAFFTTISVVTPIALFLSCFDLCNLLVILVRRCVRGRDPACFQAVPRTTESFDSDSNLGSEGKQGNFGVWAFWASGYACQVCPVVFSFSSSGWCSVWLSSVCAVCCES